MKKKKNVLILAQAQFGYHIDTYYYCKYLKDDCNVTYIGWDHGLERIELSNVNVILINKKKKILRYIELLNAITRNSQNYNTIIFIKYFRFISSIVRVLKRKNPLILDIRTGSVAVSAVNRVLDDMLLKIEALFFNNISVISKSLSNKLFGMKDTFILPLGAQSLSRNKAEVSGLKLLYVGTFFNRKLENILKGLGLFVKNNRVAELSLTIVGGGPDNEVSKLKLLRRELSLEKYVSFEGIIAHEKLYKYFDSHNVGISYVPITEYYQHQPVTKTYEYLMSGLPTIATKTIENMKVLNESNGILIGDTPEEFCIGLQDFLEKKESFSREAIKKSAEKYSWKSIVDNLDCYFEQITDYR